MVVPHKLQVAKHGARALRLLLVKAEMLQVTLVAEEAAAGTVAAEPMTVILTLMDVGVEEAQDMFIPLLQLKITLTDVY